MKKRLFILIVTVMVIIVCGAVIASAESGTCGENVTWDLTDGVMTISGTGPMEDYSSTEDVPWRSVRTNVTTVVVEEGVTRVGTFAFYGCTKNTQIILPETVESIGYYSFGYNHYVTNLVLPDSITDISMYAFANCYYLQSVKLPENLTCVYFYVFKGCVHLTDVVLPAKCETVESSAFESCTSLESITLPSSVVYIYGDTFKGCTSLTSVLVDANNEYLTSVNGVVYNKDKTELILYPAGKTDEACGIPYGVTTIAGFAFSENKNLRYVYFPDTLIEIKWGAFKNCTRLREVNISDKTYVYGSDVFSGCKSLKVIDVEDGNEWVSSVDGVLFNKNKTNLWVYPGAKESASYVIPDTVTMISAEAFVNCSNLVGIEVPKSVVNIGQNAFNENIQRIYYHGSESEWNDITIGDGNEVLSSANITYDYSPETDVKIISEGECGEAATYVLYSNGLLKIEGEGEIDYNPPWNDVEETIKEVEVADGITRIPGRTFSGCVNLTKIDLPDSLESLEDNALYGCTSLTEVTIPKNVKEVGGSVFEGCTSLSKVVLLCEDAEFGSDMFCECPNLKTAGPIGSGCNIEFSWTDKIPRDFFCGCESLESVIIPNSVTRIEEGAFSGCKVLGTIVIPDKVTVIEGDAFAGCDSLVSVVVPNGVVSLGSGAFTGCDSLETIVIPETVESIGSGCFYECEKLKNVNIPKNIQVIEGLTFGGCESLTEIELPSNLKTIGVNSFGYCLGLSEVIIPDTVTYIGDNAFAWCENLENVTMPPHLERLGSGAFYDCQKLKSIIVPEGVEIIEKDTFADCISLEKVVLSDTVTEIGDYAFDECGMLNSINIPESVTKIGKYAFFACGTETLQLNFKTIEFLDEYAFKSFHGIINATVNTDIPDGAFWSANVGKFVMTENVGVVGVRAFYFCDGEALVFPETTCLEEEVLKYCGFRSVILPGNMTQIPNEMFYSCDNLEAITIPEDVTMIGDEAFYNCESLKSVVMHDNVVYMGTWVFDECKNLKNVKLSAGLTSINNGCFSESGIDVIFIPEGVTSIGSDAFQRCSIDAIFLPESMASFSDNAFQFASIDVICYAGSQAEWEQLTANGVGYGNDAIKEAIVYYNCDMPSSIIDNNEGIEINYYGKAYGRFTLRDENGLLLTNHGINYQIKGYDGIFYAVTDPRGVVTIETPYLISGLDYPVIVTMEVEFPYEELEKELYSFDVVINPLTFMQKWEGRVFLGAEIGAGYEVGAKIGPVQAKASLASIGGGAEVGKTFGLAQSYENGKRNITITSGVDGELAAKAGIGLFANANIAGVGVDIGVGADAEGSIGAKTEVIVDIKDYDPNNIDHLKKIGYALIDASIGRTETDVIHELILNLLNIEFAKGVGMKTTALVDAGVAVKAEVGTSEIDIVGLEGGALWDYGAYINGDGSVSFTTSINSNAGIKIGDISYGDKKSNLKGSLGEAVFGKDFLNHGVELGATGLMTLYVEMLEESENYAFLWHNKSTDYINKFIYSGPQAGIAASSNADVLDFFKGKKGWFSAGEMADAVNDLFMQNAYADYEHSVLETHLDNFEVEIEVAAGLKAGINFGLSTISECEYPIKDGRLEYGALYVTSESFPEIGVEREKVGFTDVIYEAGIVLSNIINENIEQIKATLDTAVENGKAAVYNLRDYATDTFVSITTFIGDKISGQSFSVMSMNSDTELFEEVGIATTVGMPYIITLSDEADNVVELEDGEATLTISYDDADLQAAGIENDEELLSTLKIYKWDEEKNLYVCMGGELDWENSCVTIPLLTGGQYILAMDTKSPVISKFAVSNATARPLISANISDMSGIENFEFSIDGIVYVNDENLEKFYSVTTGNFTYTPDFDLSNGEHTATISVYDTTGTNERAYGEVTFTVNTKAPEFVRVDVPSVVNENSVIVTAEIEDDDLSTVFAYVEYDSNVYTYQMNEEEGAYVTEINNLPSIGKLVVWVVAYDNAGNNTASEKMLVLFRDESVADSDEVGIEIEAIDANKVKVCVVNFGDTLQGKLIVAGYNSDGVLDEAKSVSMVTNGQYTETELNFDREHALYKVFYWDNTEKMVPLCDVSVFD